MTDPITEVLAQTTRLEKLAQLDLLNHQNDVIFDRLTRFAMRMLDVSTSYFSVVTPNKQIFKSAIGFPEPYQMIRETPLTMSYCKYVVVNNTPLIINDAHEDDLLKDNPAVAELGAISYIGMPITLSDGTVVGSFCVADGEPHHWTDDEIEIVRDLAQIVIHELELRAELQAHQQAQTQILALIQDKERSDLLGTLIRDAMHEFKTPLSTIKTKAYLAQRVAQSDKPIPYLNAIDIEADRINDLVDSLGVLAKLEQQASLILNKGSLNDNVQVAYDKLKTEINEKHLDVSFEFAQDLPIVAYDGDMFTIAITEILENAVHYTNDGGHIHLKTTYDPEQVKVIIADNGIGIPASYIPEIFKRFTRGNTLQTAQSTGIGLAIAHKVVQKHHGTIQVESETNKGTTFTICLPLA